MLGVRKKGGEGKKEEKRSGTRLVSILHVMARGKKKRETSVRPCPDLTVGGREEKTLAVKPPQCLFQKGGEEKVNHLPLRQGKKNKKKKAKFRL